VPRGGPYVRWLYNRVVDAVIAISDGVRTALVQAGVEPARIRVVPSGVDVAAMTAPPDARAALRREWDVADDEVLVAVIGVLEKRKGHDVLLSAAMLPATKNRRVRYVFVGEGGTREVLTEAVGRLALPVHFAGFRNDVAACLAAADVVAMPSRQEGLGVAALEAMAAGRPVVASRVGGLREAVEPNVTGLLVPPDDPAALATAIGSLAANPARRAQFGAAGRERILARYTGARMADGTLACYGKPPCGG
jgi:glycosyltransferase involved in cell wall biosynthesis